MTRTFSLRDRKLALYVLWPAAWLAALIWVVGPLAGALAAARGAVGQRQTELAAIQSASAQAASIAGILRQFRSQDVTLRKKVITLRQSVNAVVSLQRLLRETGNTVLTVRVGEIQRPGRSETVEPRGALARIPVDVTARGSYASLTRFLRQWAGGSVPLKLTKVEAARSDEGGLDIGIHAAVLVPAPAGGNR